MVSPSLLYGTDSPPGGYADIVALDAGGHPALVVEVKARTADSYRREYGEAQLVANARRLGPRVTFAMLAESKQITLYRVEAGALSEPVAVLSTEETLRPYQPEIGSIPMSEYYLTALIDIWLFDLMYHLKLKSPPHQELLAGVGLLERLEDGRTFTEVPLPA